jgi:hypothetical protein
MYLKRSWIFSKQALGLSAGVHGELVPAPGAIKIKTNSLPNQLVSVSR